MSRREVILEGGKPWGFRIKGGSEFNIPVGIEEVTSAKAKNAGLLKNDVIYEINGQSVQGVTHQEAKKLIIDAGNTLKLSVEQSTVLKSKCSLRGKRPGDYCASVGSRSSPNEPTAEQKKPAPEPIVEPKKPAPTPTVEPTKPAPEPAVEQTKSTSFQASSNVASSIHKPEQETDTGLSSSGLSRTSDIKSPFLRNLMSDNSAASGKSGVTIVKPAVTLDTPVGNRPTSTVSIGARPNTGQSSGVKIGSGAAAPKQNFSAIPAGSLGGRITEPLGRGGNPSESHSKVQIVTSATFTCRRCSGSITEGHAISVAGYYFHQEHFTCKNCNEALVQSKIFKDRNQELICETCYAKTTDRMCEGCKKPVIGQYLTANGKNYHIPCFKCMGCGKNLETCGFIDNGAGLQCQNCYNEESGTRCFKCTNFILPGESYVNIDGNNMHSTCFVCEECNEVLSSFKQRDGKYICPKH